MTRVYETNDTMSLLINAAYALKSVSLRGNMTPPTEIVMRFDTERELREFDHAVFSSRDFGLIANPKETFIDRYGGFDMTLVGIKFKFRTKEMRDFYGYVE